MPAIEFHHNYGVITHSSEYQQKSKSLVGHDVPVKLSSGDIKYIQFGGFTELLTKQKVKIVNINRVTDGDGLGCDWEVVPKGGYLVGCYHHEKVYLLYPFKVMGL